MTTEQPRDEHGSDVPIQGQAWVLRRTALGAVAATLVIAVIGRLLGGWPGGWGALVGGLVAVVVFATGSFAVNAMASQDATIALMMALVTYTGQAMVLVVFLIVLARSGAMDDALSRGWLAGAVIAVAVLWSASQIVLSARARIPLYNLSQKGVEG